MSHPSSLSTMSPAPLSGAALAFLFAVVAMVALAVVLAVGGGGGVAAGDSVNSRAWGKYSPQSLEHRPAPTRGYTDNRWDRP